METKQSEQYLADVVVGSRGWLHDRWTESFYPEDIPQEWRLGFYANEFNTLLVPWAYWSESIDELEEGLDDTEDDFHLYLELPAQPQALPAHLSAIQDSVTGFVCTDTHDWQMETSRFNIRLLVRSSKDNDIFQRFTSRPEENVVELILMAGAEIEDLAMMRKQLESALEGAKKRLDVIFTDEIPDMEAMQNTRMIAELMGA